ncbi:Antilisterial bacteriocin subtilosin biosynthesis protein AlbA [Luteitalea pratensis]|uniref:Antilisterial bacteriocin subtilosin biosynthesis protein AlbA n=1 Tax=Luteitalea pratensis TaxID=1855912 RepID=A0A143PVG5_LUTPR|nr:radical SAM protein [Luteitalea pratensis]AMY12050.1 Antilisterial bacteriocin subtilosin biosynthesis protein AlbA [Luteitalea pratensis]
MNTNSFARPYVVSWNLTYRCNLACEHCYLDAGGKPQVESENFADRSELGTEECFRVIDEIATFAPECLTILTGGEPLLRRDILEIVQRAAERELWVVVGTNGVRITENVARRLAAAGARGLSLSLDALDPERHDRFRNVRGAWRNTVEGAEILNATGLPFIVQTTAGSHNIAELEAIADFAHERLAAKVWNLYFLVPTGRGQFVSDISPAQYDEVLASLYRIQRKYSGRMLVNAKCAPHYIKTVLQNAAAQEDPVVGQAESTSVSSLPGLPGIRTYSGGAGGCPAGTHYMGIRPNGDVTPCPYLPVFAGTLRTASLADLWTSSELFTDIRRRNSLGGRCGECEMNGHCGGCRARAFGMTGDLMAEDPLCTHTPGTFAASPLLLARRSAGEGGAGGGPASVAGRQRPTVLEYGPESPSTVAWDDAATARMKKVPAFVRGMVMRAVEESCRKSGLDRVTVEELERIRARMPTPKMFG